MSEIFSDIDFTKVCTECGKEFTISKGEFKDLEVCRECSNKRHQEFEAQRERNFNNERSYSWRQICPPLYLQSDIQRLIQLTGQEKYEKVLSWEYNPKGLLLNGETGKGKTRLMYLLLKQYHWQKKNIVAQLLNDFSIQCQNAFMNGHATDWLRDYYNADILFLDDFGNQRFTDRMEDSLFSIIEHRYSHLKPIMITTNYTGETLKEKISGDRANAMIRRLREFSESINF